MRVGEAMLAPVVRAMANIRLMLSVAVLLTSLEWLGSGIVVAAVMLCIPGNLMLLFRWGKQSNGFLVPVWFACLDAVLLTALLVVVSGDVEGLAPLPTGYMFISAVMIGVSTGNRVAATWVSVVLAGLFWLVALSISPWWQAGAAFVAVAALVCLGRWLAREVARIEQVDRDLVQLRVVQAGAQERLVLARDLHDTVAKSAAGIRMLAEVLHDSLAACHSDHVGDAARLFEAADALSVEARAVLDELRTEPDNDVRRLLEQDAATWGRRVGQKVDIVVGGDPVSVDSSLAWQAQRALGEILANIERHAKASKVSVTINGCVGVSGSIKDLEFKVEDNGVGLPRQILSDPTSLRGSGHYGLCGIQERVALIGGSLRLAASRSGGTLVRVSIPAHEESVVSKALSLTVSRR